MAKKWWAVLSFLSLAGCLVAPVLRFLGKISPGAFKLIFLFASFGWFIFATLWSRRR